MLPIPTKLKVLPKVDWHKRDIELNIKVKDILLKAEGSMSRTGLDKELGGHGWLIRMQHKLPLTMSTFYKLAKPKII